MTPRRTLRAGLATAVLGWPGVLAWQVQGLPPEAAGRWYVAHTGLACLLAVGLLARRWLMGGPFGRGWGLLALGQACYLGTQTLRLAGGPPGLWALLEVAGAFLQSGALLAWPWSLARDRSRSLWALGALLFSGSLFLLLWLLGSWQTGMRSGDESHLKLLLLSGRLLLLGGGLLYLLSDRPERALGPLGWVMGSLLSLAFIVGNLQIYLEAPGGGSLVFALALWTPLCMAAAAQDPRDPESGAAPSRTLYLGVRLLPFLPYGLSVLLLSALVLRGQGFLKGPVLLFLGVTGILLLRQYLLFRALEQANAGLEAEVAVRTRGLEEAQRILLRTERMNAVALLGAGVIHDLNNLLGAVKGTAELMLEDLKAGQPPIQADVEQIVEASAKAGALGQRLMDYGRGERGVVEEVDLGAQLQALRPMLDLVMRKVGRLEVRLPAEPCRVRVRRQDLEQVVVNLVGNARDALGLGGQVRLILSCEPEWVHLEVEDNGAGMPEAVLARIFEPLFTTKGPGKGTGLGLATVRLLVEEAGGQVEVESSEGSGTTFHLVWPRVS